MFRAYKRCFYERTLNKIIMEEYTSILVGGLKLTGYVLLAAAHLFALMAIVYHTVRGLLILVYKLTNK